MSYIFDSSLNTNSLKIKHLAIQRKIIFKRLRFFGRWVRGGLSVEAFQELCDQFKAEHKDKRFPNDLEMDVIVEANAPGLPESVYDARGARVKARFPEYKPRITFAELREIQRVLEPYEGTFIGEMKRLFLSLGDETPLVVMEPEDMVL